MKCTSSSNFEKQIIQVLWVINTVFSKRFRSIDVTWIIAPIKLIIFLTHLKCYFKYYRFEQPRWGQFSNHFAYFGWYNQLSLAAIFHHRFQHLRLDLEFYLFKEWFNYEKRWSSFNDSQLWISHTWINSIWSKEKSN